MTADITHVIALSLLAVTYALIHFIWQGAVLAGILAIWLQRAKHARANTRYLCAVFTLSTMALCPLATMFVLNRTPTVDSPTHSVLSPNSMSATLARARNTIKAERQMNADSTSLTYMFREGVSRNSKWIVLSWLTGILFLSLRGVGGWLRLRLLLIADKSVKGDIIAELTMRVAELGRTIGISRVPQIRVAAHAPTVLVYGAVRSVIVFPTSAILGLTPAMLNTILVHELAHLRRHDFLVNLAQCLIETALFFHPAVWWVSNRVRDEREMCCDDTVIETLGDRLMYARALQGLEELRSQRVAIAVNGGRLIDRIQRIIQTGTPNMNLDYYARSKGQLAAGICAVALGIGMISAIQATSAQTIADTLRTGQETPPSSAQTVPPYQRVDDGKALTSVEGPGITITLSDSVLKPTAGNRPGEGLIRDVDLQQLVHELQKANARYIAINGRKVNRDIRIRAHGNSINIDNVPTGGTFVVVALGDPAELQKTVDSENGVLARLRQFDPKMVNVESSNAIRLIGANQSPVRYLIRVRVLRCVVADSGGVSETAISTPSAMTFAGMPASFSTSTTSKDGQIIEGETLSFNPSPAPRHRIQLDSTFTKTEQSHQPMHAETPPGYTVERGKPVRILGVLSTGENELRKAVERGQIVRNRGAYTAYYVEVNVE